MRQTRVAHAVALALALSGLLVALLLAPKDRFFLGNVAWFWLPQLPVLLLASFYRPDRSAALAGTAVAMAAYLAAFGAWRLAASRPEALAWLGYVYSLPGAAVGVALGAAISLAHTGPSRRRRVAATFAAAVLVGIGLNQGVVCGTVIHCALR